MIDLPIQYIYFTKILHSFFELVLEAGNVL